MPDTSKKRLSFTENAELSVGAAGAVVATNEILESIDAEDKTSHLLKAGIGAAVAIGAWELIRRAEEDGQPITHWRSRTRSRSRSCSGESSRSRSPPSNQKHHGRHLAEEIIGAYSLGKELLGDRKHHVAHLVGEALGATGLIQELRAKDKADEKRAIVVRK